jgi:hypothetical protein
MVPVGSETEKLASALVYPATCGLGAAAARAASTEVVKMALVNMLIMLQRVCECPEKSGNSCTEYIQSVAPELLIARY